MKFDISSSTATIPVVLAMWGIGRACDVARFFHLVDTAGALVLALGSWWEDETVMRVMMGWEGGFVGIRGE